MVKYIKGTGPIVGERQRYVVDSDQPFKISRTKIELFYNCPRCFYKNIKLGLREPSSPGWAINSAVDSLLKKEMDFCRKEDRPHAVFKENNLNIKPFKHEDIEMWQNSRKGIQFLDKEHNFLLYGGVDDIMINENDKLVVIDFKATAKKSDIISAKNVYGNGASYKRQLEIYSWLLQQNGFDVSSTGYLMYYNGDASKPYLGQEMYFRRTLVPFELDTEWIAPMISKMHEYLQLDKMPSEYECDECLYIETAYKL
ncbi:MAG TPA: PD-(D/E)XK nuclease family protein [Candidatus Marinimicrobia bacterium]|nr:PD-(D/E)XK nuclease family protein [Candidatus Neomarinimicrobiota bacterium]